MAYNLIHTTTFTAANTSFNATPNTEIYDGWFQSAGNSFKANGPTIGLNNNGGVVPATTYQSAYYPGYSFKDGRVTIPYHGNNPAILLRSSSSGGLIQTGVGFFVFSGNTIYKTSVTGGVEAFSSLSSCDTTGCAFVRVGAKDASAGHTTMTLELLDSSGNLIPGQIYTYDTTLYPATNGFAAIGAFNGGTNYETAQIEEYSATGPIIAGSIQETETTTPAYFKGASKTKNSLTVVGSDGGFAALNYTFKYRIFGSGSSFTALTRSTSASAILSSLLPNTKYEAYATLDDGGTATPQDTAMFTFTTAAAVVANTGDSTTYGVGSSGNGPATSWPIMLQTTLKSSAYSIQTLNFGSSGATIQDVVGSMITGSGPSAVFNSTWLGYIATYGIDIINMQIGANNARNDQIGKTTSGGTPTVSVATSKAAYKERMSSLDYACRAAGIKLAMNYPFYCPPSPSFGTSGWSSEADSYILAYCAAIDELQSPYAIRVSTAIHGAYATFKAYCIANSFQDVHPPAAFYSQYGNTELPADWKAAFTPLAAKRFVSSLQGSLGLKVMEVDFDAYTDTGSTTKAFNDNAVIAAFQRDGINAVQATSGKRPILKKGKGLGGKSVLYFDGVDDALDDTAFAFGAQRTILMVGVLKRRSNGIQVAAGFGAGSFLVQTTARLGYYDGSGGSAFPFLNANNYPAVMGYRRSSTDCKLSVDDRVVQVPGLSATTSETAFYLGSTNGNYFTEGEWSMAIVLQNSAMSAGDYTTLLSELSAYLGGVPMVTTVGKKLLVAEGNSIFGGGILSSNNDKFFLQQAIVANGNSYDMRAFGVASSTMADINARAAYTDAYPATVGTTRALSTLSIGEGTNDPTNFTAFRQYVLDRVTAGWGKIIVFTPPASNSPSTPPTDANITTFYNQVKAEAWPSNVIVVDTRQAPMATWSATYMSDAYHPKDAGQDQLALMTGPAVTDVPPTTPSDPPSIALSHNSGTSYNLTFSSPLFGVTYDTDINGVFASGQTSPKTITLDTSVENHISVRAVNSAGAGPWAELFLSAKPPVNVYIGISGLVDELENAFDFRHTPFTDDDLDVVNVNIGRGFKMISEDGTMFRYFANDDGSIGFEEV